MKGLILKDLYYLKGFIRTYLLILAFMAVWSVMVKNSSFIVTYLLVIGNTLILSTSTMDESVSFNRFALTMPINMKMLVKAKYTLLVIVEMGALLIGLVMGLLVRIIPYRLNGVSLWGRDEFDWMGIIILFVLFMLICCITLPAIFKLGVEKARHIYVAVMIGIFILVFGGFKLCQMAGISLDGFDKIEKTPEAVVFVLLALCVGAVLISYRISLRIVSKKEW